MITGHDRPVFDSAVVVMKYCTPARSMHAHMNEVLFYFFQICFGYRFESADSSKIRINMNNELRSLILNSDGEST